MLEQSVRARFDPSGHQIVDVTVHRGYQPDSIRAQAGVPLRIVFRSVLFVGLWLGRQRLTGLGDGVIASAYLFGLAVVRFGLFFLRDEPAVLFGLKTAQWLGLGIAALAVALLVLARSRARPIPAPSIQLEASRP